MVQGSGRGATTAAVMVMQLSRLASFAPFTGLGQMLLKKVFYIKRTFSLAGTHFNETLS
jgi:hypothetical protein